MALEFSKMVVHHHQLNVVDVSVLYYDPIYGLTVNSTRPSFLRDGISPTLYALKAFCSNSRQG